MSLHAVEGEIYTACRRTVAVLSHHLQFLSTHLLTYIVSAAVLQAASSNARRISTILDGRLQPKGSR